MTVVMSTLLGVDGSTADADNLVTPSAFFVANYGEGPVTLTSSYETVEERSRTGAAQRYGIRDRPLISVSATTSPIRSEQVRAANDQLVRRTRTRQPFPIYSDSFKVTRVSGQTLNFEVDSDYDLENIRLEEGQYLFAVVIDPSADSGPGCITEFQVVDVTQVRTDLSPQRVSISEALTISGVDDTDKVLRFYPAIESEVSSETDFAVLNDEVDNINLVAEQTPRANSISPVATVAAHGRTNVAQYNFHEPLLDCGTDGGARCETLPVFDFKPNFVSSVSGTQKANIDRTKVGLGREIERYGDQGVTSFDFQMLFLNRASAFEFIKFWHSRRGRLLPFWMPSLSTELKVTNIANTSGDEYLVTAEGDFANANEVEKRKFICFITKDNERLIARIKSGTAGVAGGTVNFTIDASNSVDASRDFGTLVTNDTISMTRFAFLGHFSSDSITENWTSNGICQISVGVEELQLEKDTTLATALEAPTVAGVTEAYSETCIAGCPDGEILGSCTDGDCCYCIQSINVDLNLSERVGAQEASDCGCRPKRKECCEVRGVGNVCQPCAFTRIPGASDKDVDCDESTLKFHVFGFEFRGEDKSGDTYEYQVFLEWYPQNDAGDIRFKPHIGNGKRSINGGAFQDFPNSEIWYNEFLPWFRDGKKTNGASYGSNICTQDCGLTDPQIPKATQTVQQFAPICEGYNEYGVLSVQYKFDDDQIECCNSFKEFSEISCDDFPADPLCCENSVFNSCTNCEVDNAVLQGACQCGCCDFTKCQCRDGLVAINHPQVVYRMQGYDISGSCEGGNACGLCSNPFTMFNGLDFGLAKFGGSAQKNFTIINV